MFRLLKMTFHIKLVLYDVVNENYLKQEEDDKLACHKVANFITFVKDLLLKYFLEWQHWTITNNCQNNFKMIGGNLKHWGPTII